MFFVVNYLSQATNINQLLPKCREVSPKTGVIANLLFVFQPAQGWVNRDIFNIWKNIKLILKGSVVIL